MNGSATSARVVPERRSETGGVPLWVNDSWGERFPWAIAATTGAGDGASFDLGLSGEQPVGAVLARWRALIAATGMNGAAHSRQAHGKLVQTHAAAHTGLLVSDGFDGHATGAAGLLLTASVADCVPIFLLDPETRAIALLHAGWRGVAAGILDVGLAALAAIAGARAERLWMHAGPAICGRCYEVGPEVHQAVGLPRPSTNSPIDLRAVLAARASDAGLDPEHVSVSAHCTRCGPGEFFSYRAGHKGRQMGVLGVLPG